MGVSPRTSKTTVKSELCILSESELRGFPGKLQEHALLSLSTLTEMFYICIVHIVATNQVWMAIYI